MSHQWPELNRTLTLYGTGEEQAAYEEMQQAAFRVAEALMAQPPATMTTPIADTVHFVGELRGQAEIFCLSDFSDAELAHPEGNYSLFLVSQFEGLSASDLRSITAHLECWLQKPEFLQRDGVQLQRLVDVTYGRA